jgi:hypothetical protein
MLLLDYSKPLSGKYQESIRKLFTLSHFPASLPGKDKKSGRELVEPFPSKGILTIEIECAEIFPSLKAVSLERVFFLIKYEKIKK